MHTVHATCPGRPRAVAWHWVPCRRSAPVRRNVPFDSSCSAEPAYQAQRRRNGPPAFAAESALLQTALGQRARFAVASLGQERGWSRMSQVFLGRLQAAIVCALAMLAFGAAEMRAAGSGGSEDYAGAFLGVGKVANEIVDIDGFADWGNPGSTNKLNGPAAFAGVLAGRRLDMGSSGLRFEIDALGRQPVRGHRRAGPDMQRRNRVDTHPLDGHRPHGLRHGCRQHPDLSRRRTGAGPDRQFRYGH